MTEVTPHQMFIAHLPLYLGQVVLLVTIIIGYTLILRRIGHKTVTILQQAMDLTVKQQEITLLIAKTLEDERLETAEAVRKSVVQEAERVANLVVTEAEGVRHKVESAAEMAEEGFSAGAVVVNEKLDQLTTQGAEGVNKKLDSLLDKSKEPVKVEVTNTPLATEVVTKGKK